MGKPGVDKEKTGKEKRGGLLRVTAIVLCSAIIAAAGSALTYLYIGKHGRTAVFIQTSGPKEVTVDYGTDYQDRGAVAFAVNELGEAEELATVTNGQVDVSRLGKYELTYSAMYQGTQYTDKRTVQVVDREKPVLKAGINENQEVNWMTGPREYTITASDGYDGDLTDRITKTEQDGKIIYSVEDSSGNLTTLLLRAPDEIEAPVIEFDDGPDGGVIYTFQNEEPVMPKAFAVDGADNELTEWIQTDGAYDISAPGTYSIRYFLSNYKGETVEEYRTVAVVQLMNPDYIHTESEQSD